MKALIFISQIYQLNGAEKLGYELAINLNKIGIHADVVTLYSRNTNKTAVSEKELLLNGVKKVHFLNMKVKPNPIQALLAAFRLKNIISSEQYDIVETSQVTPSTLAIWATLISRKKVVIFTGIHQVFSKANKRSVREIIWLISLCLHRNSFFYSVSFAAEKAWQEYSFQWFNPSKVIYNSINDKQFVEKVHNSDLIKILRLPADSKILLFVGRLTPSKGILTLLTGLKGLLLQENLVLLYVGDPDFSEETTSDTIKLMKQIIKDNSLDNRVRFLGHRKDISNIMAASDILIHPTQSEAFGLVLVEALAAQLPIIANKLDGVVEVLNYTESILINTDNEKTLQESVINILRRGQHEKHRCAQIGLKRAEYFRSSIRTQNIASLFRGTYSVNNSK